MSQAGDWCQATVQPSTGLGQIASFEVLQEQLRQTRDRFNVGEVTRTDVAQAESRLAAGRSQVRDRTPR